MIDNLKNKKIGIFGLGITGQSVYSTISVINDNIICWDDSEKNQENFPNKEKILSYNNEKWQNLDIIFISPGVPHSHPIFKLAKENNIAISSDIELFLHQNPDSKIIAITGTNGKSTTTALTHHILKEAAKYDKNYDFPMGGNIGIPILSLPKNKAGYVLELSSFQLDLLNIFNPNIAVLLNITPDHLDRYSSFAEYQQSKMKILQGDSIKIIGINNAITSDIYTNLAKYGEKKLIPISSEHALNKNTISCEANKINDDFYDNMHYHMPDIPQLPGRNNSENIAASYAICRSLGLKSENIISAIKSFKTLPHRMQYIDENEEVCYYNDSKATNTDAAAGSLSAMDNVFWLAGGILKEDDLSSLDQALSSVKKAYLFGKSKEIFAQYLANNIDYEIFETMQEAFIKANQEAKAYSKQTGQKANIVLAPACSSFDQFKNFEERGEQFAKLCYTNSSGIL